MKVDRLFQLLRYHHGSQLIWRGRSLLRQQWQRRFPGVYRSRVGPVSLNAGAGMLLAKLRQRRQGLWPLRQTSASLRAMAQGEFRFLNQTFSLGTTFEEGDFAKHLNWQPEVPRLWRFHLHYHESLLELAGEVGPDAAWAMVQSWLDFPSNQTPHLDADAWHPFCLSMRLPHWLMLAATDGVPVEIDDSFWQSLSEQVDWLWRHPEWDLGGNHLLENLRTLAIADATLTGDNPIDRRQLYRWIDREIDTQLLPSGEHYERTPTYHALMLLALIEIADSAETVGVTCRASQGAQRMAQWLETILHPDDQIPLFGDSVLGETPSPRVLIREATALEKGHRSTSHSAMADSDYWVCSSTDGQNRLIVDLGDTGCDHLPAHAHADLLTLEASALGQRLFVDTGTFDYEDTPERSHSRSTAAHNTACIDQISHCDQWSRFRMGRRGHVIGRKTGESDTHTWCLAAHDAYRHLGIPRVYRLVIAENRSASGLNWSVADWFEGKGEHRISSPLHVGPAFKVVQGDADSTWTRLTTEDSHNVFVKSLTPTKLSSCDYFPDFGVRIPLDRLMQSISTSERNPLIWYISTTQNAPLPRLKVTGEHCAVTWTTDVTEPLFISTTF